MFSVTRWITSLLLLAASCGDNLEPTRDPLAIQPLTDTNPDPTIVEVSLVAEVGTVELIDGKPAEIWGYRDGARSGATPTIPGPLLEANQGDQIIVHFTNMLPEPTTIHWHGIRLPNQYDGSDHTQTPVPPGGAFDYAFTVPDAATFWYHPHVRGDVQVEKGLYAPLVVHGGVEPEIDAERVFVLDDVKLAANGALDDSQSMDDMMFGRQGNTLLVNGRVGATLSAHAGARERWRLVDAANSRFFKLSLPGHPFLVIAWDGGLIPEPYMTDTLLMAPGERYDVIVTLDGEAGSKLALETGYYDRARGMLPDPGPLPLMTIALEGSATDVGPLPTSWGEFEPIPATASSIARVFTFHEDSGPNGMVFSINGEVYPNVTPVEARSGDVEVWTINDDVGMDHPFHLHGMFFQVLDVGGVPVEHRGWKDTVIVPAYTALRFAVRQGGPGMWMYHCHILEHQEGGMMGVLHVSP